MALANSSVLRLPVLLQKLPNLNHFCWTHIRRISASIRIQPEDPLVDDDLDIKLNDLGETRDLTVVARLNENGFRFMSWAHYTSDTKGRVDFTTQDSQGGTYTGREPNGLIWSLQAEEGQRKGLRLLKRDVTTPLATSVNVYDGHFNASNLTALSERSPLASTLVNRWYMGRHMLRKEVRDDGLVGTFFIPRGGGPYPAVLDLFGTVGGTVEHRSALLASRGFATFALCYFNPQAEVVLRADMEYFEAAVDWMTRQPNVSQNGAGVIGVSKGFEMALLTSVVCPKVTAVIGINGTYHNNLITHTYKCENFRSMQEFNEAMTLWYDENNCLVMKNLHDKCSEEVKEECAIPIERSRAKFLLVFGDDDQCTDRLAAEYIPRRLELHGRPDDCQVVVYPGAGHLIEPPHSQFCDASYHATFATVLRWGGDARSHARAQEQHWPLMQNFLRKHLSD